MTSALTASRIIPARFPGKTCRFCGVSITVGSDVAYLSGGTWYNACATCADSHPAQVRGLVQRVEALAADLADTTALVAQVQAVEADVALAIGGDTAAAQRCIPSLLALASTVVKATDPMSAAIAALRTALVNLPQRDASFAMSLCDQYDRTGSLSPRQAPYVATLLAKATAPATEATGPAPLGLHTNAQGEVVKVYRTQNGYLAGKVLVGHSFTYRKGAAAGLSADTLMTAEQARAYGRSTGVCCNCGLEIGHGDTENTLRSLAAGYGPTCAERNGWPYPAITEAVATLRAEGITHPLLVQDEAEVPSIYNTTGVEFDRQYQARFGRAANE